MKRWFAILAVGLLFSQSMVAHAQRNRAEFTTDVMVGGAAMKASMNIVENASNASNLTTLVAAVKAAALVDTLKGEGPFTVFAPTNDAFGKIPQESLDKLMMPENKDMLAKILSYHVVMGTFAAGDLTNGRKLVTVQGGALMVKVADGVVWLMDEQGGMAMVETPDVFQSNGVVHVINSVLMPGPKMEKADQVMVKGMVGDAMTEEQRAAKMKMRRQMLMDRKPMMAPQAQMNPPAQASQPMMKTGEYSAWVGVEVEAMVDLHVRKGAGAGTMAVKIWKKGMRAMITDVKGKWCKIDAGWSACRYLKP